MADVNGLEMLMALMAAKKLAERGNIKITPYAVKIDMTPESIDCHVEAHKGILEDLDVEGAAWLEETNSRIEPIMKEQTRKLIGLMGKMLGFNATENSAGGGKTDSATDFFEEFFK